MTSFPPDARNAAVPATLAAIVRMHAAGRPDRMALHIAGESRDYRALDQRSTKVANALRAAGVGPAARVAFLGKTSHQYFELVFGTAKINAVAVPINWRLAAGEVAAILNDSQATVLVVDKPFEELVESVRTELPAVDEIISLDSSGRFRAFESWLAEQSPDDPDIASAPTDIALQVYTSGTTGRPKGAMISNSSLIALLTTLSGVARIRADSVTMCSLPMFHIGGSAWALSGLLQGCTTVLHTETVAAEMLRTIPQFDVTVAFAVPAVVQRLVEAPEMADADCSSLRTLYYGGSPITESVLRRALAVLRCDFVQGFGMTECGLITALDPEHHDPDRHPELLRSCGRALPTSELRLVDPLTLEDVADGDVGELWVRSPLTMSGYFNKPDETAAAITADGWLRTGDLGRMDARGFFYIEDRIKDMIVSGGENVYSAEVENVLMAHAAVGECAVIGVPSERWGETVKAIVVLDQGREVSERDLIAFCRERLAHYKCPTSVEFIAALPRTPSGKVIKHELRARFARA